jgi:hypothetical protein
MPEIATKHSRDLRERIMEAAWAYHPILFPTEIAALYRICGKELTNHLGIKLSMSTAFHPQADGQQDDWAELLLLAEHAYNTAVSETTKTSPFFANYGHQPETQPEIAIEHYRESRILGRRLNEREKRMEYMVFWKGHPPGKSNVGTLGESQKRGSIADLQRGLQGCGLLGVPDASVSGF